LISELVELREIAIDASTWVTYVLVFPDWVKSVVEFLHAV